MSLHQLPSLLSIRVRLEKDRQTKKRIYREADRERQNDRSIEREGDRDNFDVPRHTSMSLHQLPSFLGFRERLEKTDRQRK